MFSKLKWFNRGDPEATDDNSVLNAKNMNDLEQRIEDGFNTIDNQNAGSHNAIFRGKDITSYLDDGSLWDKISSGKFEDLYIGDYFLKNGIKYRIAGFDYYLHRGKNEFTKHHIVIVPDTNLTTAQMNTTDDTTGGYLNSNMATVTLPNILTTIENIFGSTHVLEFDNLLTYSINKTYYNRFGTNTGATTDWKWATARKVDLMSEVQVFGSISWSSSGYDTGSMNTQLPLFRLAPEYICNRETYWLRDVNSGMDFTRVFSSGYVDFGKANNSHGVRPFFFIGTSEE